MQFEFTIDSKKLRWALSALVGVALAWPAWTHATGSVPNTFAGGEVISAQEINENFQDLSDRIDSLGHPTYRWAVFSTFDHQAGWNAGNNAALFGGVDPSNWTDGNALATEISADKDVQRALFTQKGYARKNALVFADAWYRLSSTDGKVAMALFRVRNTTASAIAWTVELHYTAYGPFQEYASAALNGSTVFASSGSSAQAGVPATLSLSIPANRTSTAIFVSTSGSNQVSPNTMRSVLLAFSGDSLVLPAGLEFVDDLSTATGGYEQ